VKRLTTNTPLQALVMMNDPQVLEAARVLAARLLEAPGAENERLRKAFRLIICRQPEEKEMALLAAYYHDQQQTFAKAPAKAEKILSVGEYPLPQNINKPALAAMMQVVTMVYNLEEAITKT
jgi:hypothetical protein